MAARYHIRVCAVGSKKQLELMLSVMMRNAALLDEEEDEDVRPPRPSMQEMLNEIYGLTRGEGGEADGFLYEMIGRTTFGTADRLTSRMSVEEQPCGEWAACFDYHSADPLQNEDWQRFQRDCDGLLMCAQYACDDPGKECGRIMFTAGKALCNWDSMEECWLWLTHRYLSGGTPADLPDQLDGIGRALESADIGLTVDELLNGCEENLRLISEALADPEEMKKRLANAAAEGRFGEQLDLRTAIAEGILWEIDRMPLWLACLEEARSAWEGRI